MKAILLSDNATWRRNDALRAVRDGLEHLGFCVEVHSPHCPLPHSSRPERKCDLIVAWNGRKGKVAQRLDEARAAYPGVRVLILERGFFQRMRYSQVDSAGFNHLASWANELLEPAPPRGARRFFKVFGSRPARQEHRTGGYALLLGQVEGDVQLRDCCIHRPQGLYELVAQAMPKSIPLRIRPHPLSSWRPPSGLLEGTLRQAVRDARFCVTLNSNAANQAIAWGCPVLAFGPALCVQAGAARRATLATLPDDLQEMTHRWKPTKAAANRLLYHLACRQFNAAELREGSALKRIAGV